MALTVPCLLNGEQMRHLVFLLCVLGYVSSGSDSAYAQAKWWWEKYPSAINKTLDLKSATGGQVTTKQNATGGAASVSSNAATQPPTVIIQQTASASGTVPSGFCVNPSSSYYDPSYGPGAISTAACASLPGHQLTTMTSATTTYDRNNGRWFYPITACCYTPVGTVGAGAPSYTPWTNNTAFASNGYAGTQHQDFTAPGTYTFAVPNGVYRIWITAVGGGGGGGQGASTYVWAGNSSYSGGGGGRGGILYRYPMDVIPGTSLTVKVGSGGNGAAMGHYTSYSQPLAGSPGQGSFVAAGTSVATVQGGSSGPGGYYTAGYSGQASIAGTYSYASAGNPSSAASSTGTGGNYGYVGAGPTSGVTMGPGQAGGGIGGSGYASANNGEGNNYNQSGAGVGGGLTMNNINGGGGGAAGFIGMPWSTGVPSGSVGTASTATYSHPPCITKPGSGGFGFGAGGGGGAGVGYDQCAGAGNSMQGGGAGGKGADGAVWLEW